MCQYFGREKNSWYLSGWYLNQLTYLKGKPGEENSMLIKPLWPVVANGKKWGWDTLSMVRLFCRIWVRGWMTWPGKSATNTYTAYTIESSRNQHIDTLYATISTKGNLRIEGRIIGTSWSPKARKGYGDGAPILAVRKVSSRSNVTVVASEGVQHNENRNTNLCCLNRKLTKELGRSAGWKKKGKRDNIYYETINEKRLKIAYELIKGKKGVNTPGTDTTTLDGLSNKMIEKMYKSLKDHSFKFKPIRRVYIPKKNGEKRQLGIPNPRDKIILKSMTMSLEARFEKEFMNSSHGFRPNRSTHSALRDITKWTGTKWFIEGDISKYFDSINWEILANMIRKKVKNEAFIDLYWKSVKVSYIDMEQKKEYIPKQGSPQGSTLSPLLSNIYLHEFDKFMWRLCEQSKRSGNVSKDNPEYKKIHTKISNLRSVYSPNYRWKTQLNNEDLKERLKEILNLEKSRRKLPSKIADKGYRIYYVRYADDFLIGVNGQKEKAEEIRGKIKEYLEETLKLKLNMNKTHITSATKSRARFLGATIRALTSRTNDTPTRKRTETGRKIRARTPQGYIRAFAPIEDLTKKLEDQGMCNIIDFRNRKVIPHKKSAWINLELYDIIQRYSWLMRGILNYYSFAYNRSSLNFIVYIIQHSAACTIMNKMRMNSRRQVFRKYGKTLKISKEVGKKVYEISLPLPKSLARINKFNTKVGTPLKLFDYSLRSKLILDQPCSVCGSLENIEMHHRKPLKKGTTDNTLKGVKINMRRKQIPVCRKCHMKIHGGKYTGKKYILS